MNGLSVLRSAHLSAYGVKVKRSYVVFTTAMQGNSFPIDSSLPMLRK